MRAKPGYHGGSLAVAVTLGLVGIAGLLLLLVDHSSTIVRLLAGQLAGPTTTLRSAAPAAAGGGGRHPVLPPDWGGVQHYRIPGALMPLQPEVDVVPITGTLHVYLNAARWPDGHLRAKGFVAFLPWAAPASWAKIPRLDKRAMGNMVEVYHVLELGLRSRSQRWERALVSTLSLDMCERGSGYGPESDTFDYNLCVSAGRTPWTANRQWGRPVDALLDISLDFGPAAAAPSDVELFVSGWPRFVSLQAQLQRAKASPPALTPAAVGGRPPTLVRALPYFKTISADRVALAAERSMQYHATLGMNRTVLYVLPKDTMEFGAHPRLRALVASGALTLVQWDELAAFEGWRDFDLRIQQSHAALSHWGRHAQVLLSDMDEFVVPARAGDTLPAMLRPGGCLAGLRPGPACTYFCRRNIFPAAGGTNETQLWVGPGPSPLLNYTRCNEVPEPKVMVLPERVFPISIHYSGICAGTNANYTIADGSSRSRLRSPCTAIKHCSWVPEDCAWIAHATNMFGRREAALPEATAITPTDWLWMLKDNS